MTIPANNAKDVLKCSVPESLFVQVSIQLVRVSSLKEGVRTVVFLVNGSEQHVNVKDTGGKFVFEGPMADTSDSTQVSISCE